VGGEPNNIVGVLHAKALLRRHRSAYGRTEKVDAVALGPSRGSFPTPPPCSTSFIAFRGRREHFAMVVDEYGTRSAP